MNQAYVSLCQPAGSKTLHNLLHEINIWKIKWNKSEHLCELQWNDISSHI